VLLLIYRAQVLLLINRAPVLLLIYRASMLLLILFCKKKSSFISDDSCLFFYRIWSIQVQVKQLIGTSAMVSNPKKITRQFL
jgi:hypothetical protein